MSFLRNVRKGFMYLRDDWSPAREDLALVDRYLSGAERDLFFRMDRPDQQHSFKVAHLTAQSLTRFPEVDADNLTRAALLHDVGKIGAHLGLVFRTFWVFGCKLCPWLMEWVSLRSERAPRTSLRGRMWLQRAHPFIGAQMLRGMEVDAGICEIIEATATRRMPGDSLEVQIVKAADGDMVLTPETVYTDARSTRPPAETPQTDTEAH